MDYNPITIFSGRLIKVSKSSMLTFPKRLRQDYGIGETDRVTIAILDHAPIKSYKTSQTPQDKQEHHVFQPEENNQEQEKKRFKIWK